MTIRKMSQIITNRRPTVMGPQTTVKHACECMRAHQIGAILITDAHGKLLGIFTGRDAVCRVLAEGRNAATTRLSQVMTHDPRTIPPSNTALDALRLMHEGGYRHLPVVDRGQVVGIVSRADFRGLEQDRLDEESQLWERI